jgi:hypothetical protein
MDWSEIPDEDRNAIAVPELPESLEPFQTEPTAAQRRQERDLELAANLLLTRSTKTGELSPSRARALERANTNGRFASDNAPQPTRDRPPIFSDVFAQADTQAEHEQPTEAEEKRAARNALILAYTRLLLDNRFGTTKAQTVFTALADGCRKQHAAQLIDAQPSALSRVLADARQRWTDHAEARRDRLSRIKQRIRERQDPTSARMVEAFRKDDARRQAETARDQQLTAERSLTGQIGPIFAVPLH